MTDTHEDQHAGRLDRRGFIAGGLRVGGALAAASLGADAAGAQAAVRAAGRVPRRGARAARPNILVIMVDQLRSPRWFGAGGNGLSLPPNIAALARGGVSFARHYTASNDCTPARAALLTGLHTHQTGCMITGASTLDPGFPTWGTMLREQGYATFWYGKWHLTRGDRQWNARNGPLRLGAYGFDGGTFPSPNGAPDEGWRADRVIASQFQQWYGEAGGDGPWCTTVSFVNPHDIAWWWRWSRHSAVEAAAPSAVRSLPANFETPAQLLARRKPRVQRSLQDTSAESFGEVPFTGDHVAASWLPFLDLYIKLQREVDLHIGAVIAALRSRPDVAANTVVIFTSDHGEYGASHGLRGKGAGMYEEGIRVPLIVHDRTGTLGAVPNSVRQQISSSVDVAPLLLTLADRSGAWRTDPRYAHIATRPDLARIIADPTAPGRHYALHATDEVLTEFALRPYAASAPRHIKGIITPAAKYATYSNWRPGSIEPASHGEEAELYDYTTREGYGEIDNRAGVSAQEGRLRALLDQATIDELQEPVPFTLVNARQRGIAEYHRLAAEESAVSTAYRRDSLQRIVRSAATRFH